jgi:DNA modification methylase
VPVIIDDGGEIIAGHTRVLAAKRLGLETVPCIVADDLTPEQVKAFRLADNKTAEMAEWDAELLSLELFNLKDFSMERFGFSSDDSDADVVEDDFDIDAATEEITEPKTALGDIWQLGRHRLMCGDSTLPGDVAALMDGACADMLLTDPPYNVAYEGKAGKIQNDSMKDGPFREFLTLAFKNAEDVMKPGAAFHIWHADSEEGYNFRGACRDAGLRIRQCLIWVKSSLVMGRQDFQWKHEPCLYGEKPTPEPPDDEEAHEPCLYGWVAGKHYWFKNRKQTTVLQFDKPNKSKEHPTMKPVKLFDYQVKCNTKPGEIVLDLFGGSGTAIMACEQNNRVAYVMELDQKYADVIVARWEAFTGGKAVLING